MKQYKIYVDRQHKGTVKLDNDEVTDPCAEAARQGIIQRSEVHKASAERVDNEQGQN